MFSYDFNHSNPTGVCRRCGRVLKKLESIRLGIGPTCLIKELEKRNKSKQHKNLAYPKLIKEEKGKEVC